MPRRLAAATLLVASKPTMALARLTIMAASTPWVRREEAPPGRQGPHEQAERGGAVHVPPAVARCHPQFIQVGQQRPAQGSQASGALQRMARLRWPGVEEAT